LLACRVGVSDIGDRTSPSSPLSSAWRGGDWWRRVVRKGGFGREKQGIIDDAPTGDGVDVGVRANSRRPKASGRPYGVNSRMSSRRSRSPTSASTGPSLLKV